LKIASSFSLLFTIIFFVCGCSSTRPADDIENMDLAAITTDSLVSLIPDYSERLHTLTGRGRALVSEPGNSDRVTVQFSSNREKSLLTIRASVGIEGGKILIDSDSVLIYNKVDKYAQKVSPEQSKISSVGSIASLNMLDLFNFQIEPATIDRIFEEDDNFIVLLRDKAVVRVHKSSGLIERVDRTLSDLPITYQSIEYEGHAAINGFQLPRKITIFSGDGESRAVFLVQDLHVNGKLPELTIELPEDIPIYRP